MSERVRWPAVIAEAAKIAGSYDDSGGATLRQVYYRLVSLGLIANTSSAYSRLSDLTAEGRRNGTFPRLVDRTRSIFEDQTWTSPEDAVGYIARVFRMNRTEGQEVSLYIGVEKDGMVQQLDHWFGDYGIPILALRGYSSQSHVDKVRDHALRQDRPAVMIYAGDFDPSGIEIPRDFVQRTGCFSAVHRIAVNPDDIDRYDLPVALGKPADKRAKAFVAEFGALVQVEMDSLEPLTLRGMYQHVIDSYWNYDTYDAVLEREADQREELEAWRLSQ